MADNLPSVIPVLSKGTEDLIESKQGKLWHIVSHSLRNPGFTSDINEEDMISFRALEAAFGQDSNMLAGQYADALNRVIARHYPNDSINAFVEIDDVKENTFTLQIGITDAEGNQLLTTKPITVTPEGIDLNLGAVAK